MIYDASMVNILSPKSDLVFQEMVDLQKYTTFQLPFIAQYFVSVHSEIELQSALRQANELGLKNSDILILGSGSNLIKQDPVVFPGLVIQVCLKGFDVVEESVHEVLVNIGAGEVWDEVVAKSVELGFSGIEAMSAIPGTAGATPIQNVGAYGVEIKDTLVQVSAVEIATGRQKIFTNAACQFSYRNSIFKQELAGQYIITAIQLKLYKDFVGVPQYSGVQEQIKLLLNENNIRELVVGPAIVREVIQKIRSKKLPDPKVVPSVGSFFKNPIITSEQSEHLKSLLPNTPVFLAENGKYKVSAGYLLEQLGYKGQQIGNLQFYPNNALVLTNTGEANFQELSAVVTEVQQRVRAEFGIELEVEPMFV